jgi:hypothetical protein
MSENQPITSQDPEVAAISEHEHLREKIEGWLKDEGISFENRAIPSQVSYFQIKANIQDFPIYVQELNQKRDCVLVHSFLMLNGAQISGIAPRTPDEKKSLRNSIFSFLKVREFSFRVNENYEDKRWIMIQRILYVEGLTRKELMNEIKDLRLRFRMVEDLIDNSLHISQENQSFI